MRAAIMRPRNIENPHHRRSIYGFQTPAIWRVATLSRFHTFVVEIPDEFQDQLDEMPALKTSFDALTPGRQRADLLYFSAPKQFKTRQARIEKWMQPILAGKGLNDDCRR